MIEFISIDKLFAHPKNPRHDLGDLTELAESIKERGVLQNLTAVPMESGSYTVVIGHRRLAAAKLAGLAEVPCAVTDMDERTQVATMLMENIQRADLTILEQAEGFQMMLDLGETMKGISEKTGFSESTVRHRVKLNELDEKKFEKAVARGGRMEDYIALEQIKDPELKNKALEAIGTNNFEWTLRRATEEEKRNERKQALIEYLEGFAELTEYRNGLLFITSFYDFDQAGWEKPERSKAMK